MRVHIVSHTPLDAPGGVPRFNRYLKRVLEGAGHEVRHWSYWDLPDIYRRDSWEHVRAEVLGMWLAAAGHVGRDDVVIGDGFWCAVFPKLGYRRVISVAHGIWGHITKDDADAGVHPENPELHEAQVLHRLDMQRRGLPIVAVSRFISEQMRLQWGIGSTVVNNAIDPEECLVGRGLSNWSDDITVVHGVNDRSNSNKGWDHIQACVEAVREWPVRVSFYSLDELHVFLEAESFGKSKLWSLMQADVSVIPSGYEGNSYYALECLNMGVPCVAYDVGLFRQLSESDSPWTTHTAGTIMSRRIRSPQRTADGLMDFLQSPRRDPGSVQETVRGVASFDQFRDGWLDTVERVCRSSSE